MSFHFSHPSFVVTAVKYVKTWETCINCREKIKWFRLLNFVCSHRLTNRLHLILNFLTLFLLHTPAHMHTRAHAHKTHTHTNIYINIYSSLVKRVLQLKIWHFWVTGIERNVCKCTFNRLIFITRFAKLAPGEHLCRRCTHRKLWHFKTFKSFSWKVTNFELWHCCSNCAIYMYIYTNTHVYIKQSFSHPESGGRVLSVVMKRQPRQSRRRPMV
jgi:hypothetical protein